MIPSPDPRTDRLYLDVGFHIATCVALTGLDDPQPGQLVAGRRQPDGTCTFTPVGATTQRYTYVAWIDRIIDGDTFPGAADPGLGLAAWDLRFRLRGIDTLDLSTLAGRNARRFVDDALDKVDFVGTRSASSAPTRPTASAGISPRAARNLRYLPGKSDPEVVRSKGLYLDQQLLDERLARPFPG